jgi:hypothetical protein
LGENLELIVRDTLQKYVGKSVAVVNPGHIETRELNGEALAFQGLV